MFRIIWKYCLAKKIVVNVTKLLSETGFRLTKSTSNSNSLLEVLLQSKIAQSSTENNSIKNKTEKILGILWNHKKDTLNFHIISHISSIFYPILEPKPIIKLLLGPKLNIQQLWKEKKEWDDKIPGTLNNR